MITTPEFARAQIAYRQEYLAREAARAARPAEAPTGPLAEPPTGARHAVPADARRTVRTIHVA